MIFKTLDEYYAWVNSTEYKNKCEYNVLTPHDDGYHFTYSEIFVRRCRKNALKILKNRDKSC